MPLADTDKIDYTGIAPNGTCVLTLADDRDWSALAEHLNLLSAKLATYRHFIASGELLRAYPGARGKPVEVIVALRAAPPPEALDVLQEHIAEFQALGAAFSWRVFDMPT
jgi:hypothetical protein